MKFVLLCWVTLVGCGSPSAGETCTQAVCPLGGHTYKLCGGATSCRYVTSDNQVFMCHACADCVLAANQVTAWCSQGGGTTTSSTGGTTSGTTTSGTTTSSTGGTTGMSGIPIGGNCSSTADCTNGTSPVCRKKLNATTGMCSADCQVDADCGTGNVCLFPPSPSDTTPGACAKSCTLASDCTTGLGCWVTLGPQACWPTDGVAEFGLQLTLNCDPLVVGCSFSGSPLPGGCSRQVLGIGTTGVCREGCDPTVMGGCPSIGGYQQACYFVDESIDMMNQPTGDKLKAPICQPDVPVGMSAQFIADGAECIDPADMMHYFDICRPGSQCETYTLVSGATPDNKCHKLCYLGNVTPPDGGVALTCPGGTSCTNVFGTSGAKALGLCK